MLAHMFREKGEDSLILNNLKQKFDLLIIGVSPHVHFRCLGEQAGLSGSLPDRSQSRLL